MAKLLLRISVILMLVLSGTALALGVMLFQQRNTLKVRTQTLENSVKQIASTIETGDETGSTITLPDDQLKTVKQIPGGPPPMDVPLNQLTVAAKYQLERLNSTRMDLSDTKAALVKTEDNLKTTTENLDSAKKNISELTETVAARDATIDEKEAAVQNITKEKEEVEAKVSTLETQMEGLQVEKRDLTDKLAQVMGRVEKMESQIDPTRAIKNLVRGRQGVILYVDPEWNFVIFTIAPDSQETIVPELELLVHRGERLVGKVRVASVVNDLAVAEIMNDWEQAPIEMNDDIIY